MKLKVRIRVVIRSVKPVLRGGLLGNGVYGGRCHMGCRGVARDPPSGLICLTADLDSY